MYRNKPGAFNTEVITHQGVLICVPKQPQNVRRMQVWCKMLLSAKRRAELGILSSYGFALPATPIKGARTYTKREFSRWLSCAKRKHFRPKFVRRAPRPGELHEVRRRKYGPFLPAAAPGADPWYVEMFALRAKGLRTTQIAARLGIEPAQVRYYGRAATAEMAWLPGRLSRTYNRLRAQVGNMLDGL